MRLVHRHSLEEKNKEDSGLIIQQLQQNIENIQCRVDKVCQISHRSIDSVQTICVSKSVDELTTKAVVDLGVTHLAENRTEKFLKKYQALESYPSLTWHFIGNLQRRKVKDVINKIDYFHALDTQRLANEIQKRAETSIKCFVQVNISGEESKQGISPEEVHSFIQDLKKFDKIEVVGLMTMAPIDATVEELKYYFSGMKKLQTQVAGKKLIHAPCTELSMGMSRDFEEAIECGSTFIRVGTDFFKKQEKRGDGDEIIQKS